MKKNNSLLIFAALFLISFLIYGNSLKGGFVYDDSYFLENQNIRESFSIKEVFLSPYNYAGSGNYRPISSLSYSLNFKLFGENPFWFHFVNLLIHSLNSILIFLLIKQIFKNQKLALIVSILFTVLPIHAENIANIKGREDALSTMFVFVSWLGFIQKKIFLSATTFFFGILSKELAMLNFIAILVFTKFLENKKFVELFKAIIPFVVAIILYLFLRSNALGESAFSFNNPYFVNNPVFFEPVWIRFILTFKIFFIYIINSILPFWLSATYHFAHFTNSMSGEETLKIIIGFGLLIFMVVSTISKKFDKTPLALGSLVILSSYILISQVFLPQGDVMAERYIYFFSFGIVVIWGYLLNNLIAEYQKVGLIVTTGIILSYAAITINRNKVWYSNYTLFESMTMDAPKSIQGHFGLGLELLKLGNSKRAKEELEIAYEINSKYPPSINALALVNGQIGNYEESLNLYKKSLLIEPNYPDTYFGLGNVFYALGNYQMARQAYIDGANLKNGKLNSNESMIFNSIISKLKETKK